MNWNWTEEKVKRWMQPAIEIPYLAERWKGCGFKQFLDSGCGPGRHALYFAENDFHVTAFDQSEEALSTLEKVSAERNLHPKIIQGDIFHMPFEDNSFDCLLDYNVSYHTNTEGYFEALRELRRVLRPGGEAYLTLLSQNDPGFLSAKEDEHMDCYTLIHAGGTPHFYASRDHLKEIFTGFEFAIPVREIKSAGLDSGKESIHFHLLLRKL